MKLKSISGLVCYVDDIAQTKAFYDALGFIIAKQETGFLMVRLNWFTIEFIASKSEQKNDFKKEADLEPKGGGIFINVAVDDVDEVYQEVVAKGLKPSSEPRDWPYGRREFVLRDPDGYKLVFFTKK